MNPHYYLMRSKKILRLESDQSFESLPLFIRDRALSSADGIKMNQEQANWRVVLFRDEIMEMDEYLGWISSHTSDSLEEEFDVIAN
jgi:hypothetical protein